MKTDIIKILLEKYNGYQGVKQGLNGLYIHESCIDDMYNELLKRKPRVVVSREQFEKDLIHLGVKFAD